MLNNDTTLLPDVRFDIYYTNFTTADQATIAALTFYNKGVRAIIQNSDDVFVVPVHAIAFAYKLPLLSMRAMDDAYSQKRDWPMLSRLFPTSASMTKVMVDLIKTYNYTGALVITTKNSYASASAITLTEQAAAVGITNVYTISLPAYPTADDFVAAIAQATALVKQYQLRPIVVATTVTSAPTMVGYLANASLYGPDFMYLFSHDISRTILGGGLPKYAKYLIEGSFCFFPKDAGGANGALEGWKNLNKTIYPGGAASPGSQWFPYDTVYTYAYALDYLMKSGIPFPSITFTDILRAIPFVNFYGASGQVSYDANRDYIAKNGYTVIQSINYTSNYYLSVSVAVNGTFNNSVPFRFFNGSLEAPNPGYCPICINGRCNRYSICVCDLEWQGDYCNVPIVYGKSENTIQWVLPIIGGILILSLIAIIYYRRRREQLVKDLAKRQRSDFNRGEIKLLDRIGRGASGAVYKAVFRGTEVAVKSLLAGSTSAAVVEEFKMETAIMCALRHPNIVLFMGSCFDSNSKEMLLVMEFCSRGSMHDLLHDMKSTLPFELLLHLATQAAQGMNFLHESDPPIIHRDLKSHNILLDDKFNAKISDFGLTRFKETNKKEQKSKYESLGTVFWSAPEVLSGLPHTEKSDVFSFGIVLWEMFHRSDPYPNMDLVVVAMEVMNKGIRPVMNPSTPQEIQELMRNCWQQDPEARPTFQTVMTKLRALSMQFPMHSFASGHASRIEAPTGHVYMVHTTIMSLYALFDKIPKPTKAAMVLHNQLLRANLELYGGYEVKMGKAGFLLVFPNGGSALNFCISTQISLMRLKWPEELYDSAYACEILDEGTKLYTGLRVRMSVYHGSPLCEMDMSSGRFIYSGPAMDKAKTILKINSSGSIVVEESILNELKVKPVNLVEDIVTFRADVALSESEDLYELLPISLSKRHAAPDSRSSPSYIVSLEEAQDIAELAYTPRLKENHTMPSWIIPFNKISIKEPIGKGQVGDYSRAICDGKEVAVKLLVNQKLREDDLIGLISDISLLSKVRHPNLLQIHGLCLKQNNISIVSDYIENGSLRDLLGNETVVLSVDRCIGIAHSIAQGMHFLTTSIIESLHIHDNFKSNNILITKNWEVKITDYGQTNIKDLARTMTSISSVAWTAPEILNGETITVKSSVYSFGIMLNEIFSRKVPYEGEHPLKVVTKILSGFRPPLAECPSQIKMLIQSCWDADPDQRPNWHVVLSELSHINV